MFLRATLPNVAPKFPCGGCTATVSVSLLWDSFTQDSSNPNTAKAPSTCFQGHAAKQTFILATLPGGYKSPMERVRMYNLATI